MKALSKLILASVLCGLGVGTVGPAVAAEPTAAPDPDLQTAKAEFEEAQLLYLRELWDDAAAKFLSAYERKPFGSFLFNAAVAFEKARKLERAVDLFQRYLDKDPQAADAADVKGRIDSLRAILAPPAATEKAAAPAPVLPKLDTKGLVIIDSKPAGASVYLDDKTKGTFATTPWQGSLPPKPVKVILEAKGFKSEEREITPRNDKVIEVFISLSEQHFLGWIEVIANVPGADVYIDRQDIGAIGKTPYTGHLKPGKHMLWLARAGYQSAEKEIVVEPGTATTHNIQLAPVDWAVFKAGGAESQGAQLLVDGKLACTMPCEQKLPPGEHQISVLKQGMEPYSTKLNFNRADSTSAEMQFSPKPPRTKAWTWAVISAVTWGTGIYLAVHGKGIKDDINSDMKKSDKLITSSDPRERTGRWYYVGADVAFGVGAATALLSLWNFLESGPPSTANIKNVNLAVPENKLSLVPMGIPNGAGLSAAGRF
jgi:hypothetical protein